MEVPTVDHGENGELLQEWEESVAGGLFTFLDWRQLDDVVFVKDAALPEHEPDAVEPTSVIAAAARHNYHERLEQLLAGGRRDRSLALGELTIAYPLIFTADHIPIGIEDDRATATVIDANALDPNTGYSPLHYAVWAGRPWCVKWLLSCATIDIDQRVGGIGATALELAVASVHPAALDIVKILLQNGASVNCKNMQISRCNKRPTSPFITACKVSSPSIVEHILTQKRDVLLPNNVWVWSEELLIPHVHVTDPNVFNVLLKYDHEWKVDIDSATCASRLVQMLAARGQFELVKHFFGVYKWSILEYDQGYHVLFSSSEWPPMFEYLLSEGCKPFVDNSVDIRIIYDLPGLILFGALSRAIFYDVDIAIIRRLLTHFTPDIVALCNNSVPQCYESNIIHHPLHAIVYSFDSDILTALLDAGFDANRPRWHFDQVYHDPLSFLDKHLLRALALTASDNAPHRFLGLFLINLNAVSPPIDALIRMKDVMDVIIPHGVAVNALSDNELAPLTIAAAMIFEPLRSYVIRILIEAGADLKYRRAKSPFTCPDSAVTAALSGYIPLLVRMIVEIGLEPIDLLADLLKVSQNVTTEREDETSVHVTALLNENRFKQASRKAVGRSVAAMLTFTRKTPALRDMCAQLERHFVDAENEHHATSDDDNWLEIDATFEKVDPLQHICRAVIVDRQLKFPEDAVKHRLFRNPEFDFIKVDLQESENDIEDSEG